MDGGMKMMALTAAMSMATAPVPSSAQAKPEPVRVGIMDLKADRMTYREKDVSIEYRTFTPAGEKEGREQQETGDDHGAVVASAFVRQYRSLDRTSPIEIYAANPFGLVKTNDGGHGLRLDFRKGKEAIEWMHQKGVRIVVTSFNSSDQPGAKIFMDRAEELGMMVFAAYSNDRNSGVVFPASDYRAISVVDASKGKIGLNLVKGSGREFDAAKAGVLFAMDGGVPQESYGPTVLVGSSFTSAKAAAYGAYVLRSSPGVGHDELIEKVRIASRPMAVSRSGESLAISYIGDDATDRRFIEAMRVASAGQQSVAASSPSNEAAQKAAPAAPKRAAAMMAFAAQSASR